MWAGSLSRPSSRGEVRGTILGTFAAECQRRPAGAFLMLFGLLWAFARSRPSKVNRIFGKAQSGSAAFVAFSQGSNDAQRTMGVITLVLAAHNVRNGDEWMCRSGKSWRWPQRSG